MKPFSEEMRYDYPDLKPDDAVLDIGGFEGNYAKAIHDKYGCHVRIYEPCMEFWLNCHLAFVNNPKIKVKHSAVGNFNGEIEIFKRGDSTGQFAEGEREMCEIEDIAELLQRPVALVKLNCEGGEFAIMERVLELGIADKVTHWQIQLHSIVPNYQARYDAICDGLAKTHNRTFFAPFVWEGWTLK